MTTLDVTTWYLEQRDPAALVAARAPSAREGDRDRGAPQLVRAEIPCPELGRFLYTAVGGDWHWTDRLPWTYERWLQWYESPGVELWVAWRRGTPCGYFELDDTGGDVELAYLGLLRGFVGRGLGGWLLTEAIRHAWARPGARRVWVHTCTLDHPSALANYERRGMRRFDVRTAPQNVSGPLGPWPDAPR